MLTYLFTYLLATYLRHKDYRSWFICICLQAVSWIIFYLLLFILLNYFTLGLHITIVIIYLTYLILITEVHRDLRGYKLIFLYNLLWRKLQFNTLDSIWGIMRINNLSPHATVPWRLIKLYLRHILNIAISGEMHGYILSFARTQFPVFNATGGIMWIYSFPSFTAHGPPELYTSNWFIRHQHFLWLHFFLFIYHHGINS